MNSIVRPIFNEKVVEKWKLWVPWTVHGTHWCAENYWKVKIFGYCSCTVTLSPITCAKKKENADAESAESKQAQIYHTCFQKLKMYLSLSQWFERRDKRNLIFFFLGQKDISMIQKEHDAVFTFKKKILFMAHPYS